MIILLIIAILVGIANFILSLTISQHVFAFRLKDNLAKRIKNELILEENK